MAAPVATARLAPAGQRMDDGFSTLITLALDTNIEFWEKSVKPPGIDGGDAIETFTMHSIEWRTKRPRELKTLTDVTTKVAYDPIVYDRILDLINRDTVITITFPDGSTLAFYGFLKSFEPEELQEGTQPEATITIIPTNYDPVNCVEEAPVLVNQTGTC